MAGLAAQVTGPEATEGDGEKWSRSPGTLLWPPQARSDGAVWIQQSAVKPQKRQSKTGRRVRVQA